MNGKELPELFGSMVFSDKVMRERLDKDSYDAVRRAITDGTPLGLSAAKKVAEAMKRALLILRTGSSL